MGGKRQDPKRSQKPMDSPFQTVDAFHTVDVRACEHWGPFGSEESLWHHRVGASWWAELRRRARQDEERL